MIQKDWGLSPEQQEILEALLACPTKKQAAQVLGIGRATLYRRLDSEPELKEAFEAARRAARQDATDAVTNFGEDAVVVLHEIAVDPGMPPHARVSAAAKLVDLTVRLREMEDIAARIEAIEEALA